MSDAKPVLFICTANICRSPLAEWMWNKVRKIPEYAFLPPAISAGTDAENGRPACPEAVYLAHANGIEVPVHTSRQVDRPLLDRAEYVICVTREHRTIIAGAYPHLKPKVHLLTEFHAVFTNPDPDIVDPYGGTKEDFEQCYERLATEITRIARAWRRSLNAPRHERPMRRKPKSDPEN